MRKIGDIVYFYGCRKGWICPCNTSSGCEIIGLKKAVITCMHSASWDIRVDIVSPEKAEGYGLDYDAIVNGKFEKHKERLCQPITKLTTR
jgi:hypothetical protein